MKHFSLTCILICLQAITLLGSNLLSNGDFSSGLDNWDYYSENTSDATFEVIEEELVINVTQPGTYDWSHGLLQGGLLIEKDHGYQVSFDAYGDNQTIRALIGKNVDPWTLFIIQDINITNESQHFSFKFIMTNETETNSRFMFNLGNASGELHIDNILVEEVPTVNLSFQVDMQNEAVSPAGVYLNGSFINWQTDLAIQMYPAFGTVYEANALVFTGDTIEYKFINGNKEDWALYEIPNGDCTKGENANRWFKPTIEGGNPELVCYNSCSSCGGVSNNLIYNPNFDLQLEAWNYWASSPSEVSCNVSDGVLIVNVTQQGANQWDSQIQHGGINLVSAGEYTLTFDARANVDQFISFGIGQFDEPWSDYFRNSILLTNDWQTYSLSFVMPLMDDHNGRIYFDFGYSNGILNFDNFNLVKKSVSDLVNVTFSVDMKNQSISEAGVHLNGSFFLWQKALELTNGYDQVYEVTLQLPVNKTFQYKFINGDLSDWGNYELVSGECASGINRVLNTGEQNSILPVVCYGVCGSCDLLNTPYLSISEIQGTKDTSDYLGMEVKTIGEVTAQNQYGFTIQDANAIRSGIFVYNPNNNQPGVGSAVEVIGEVYEYYNWTELWKIKTIANVEDNYTISPIVLENQPLNEDYESVLVTINQLNITTKDRNGNVYALDSYDNQFILNPYFSSINLGPGCIANVTGVVRYTFGSFMLCPRFESDIEASCISFTLNNSSNAGRAPHTVNFMDTSDGNPTSWSWKFGDGGTSTDQNPVHTYTSPGSYAVTLTVSNGVTENSITYYDFITVVGEQHANIQKTNGTVVIDGIEEEIWDTIATHPIIYNFENEHPTVEAYWKALWSNDGIYIFINVQDDDHWPTWKAGGNPWEYDLGEIYFDINKDLKDGLGVNNQQGHWQSDPEFVDGNYGMLHNWTPDWNNPGGTWVYQQNGEGWSREHFFPFGNFTNKQGHQMTMYDFLALDNIGFDVCIIDQDEGITTERGRKVWSNIGLNEENWFNMDDAGTIKLIEPAQTDLTLTHSYTFDDGTANDVISGANGTVIAGNIENGGFVADEQGEYIELPASQIAINTYNSLTLEAFIQTAEGMNDGFTMLSYLGGSVNNMGSNGLFISVARGDDNSRTAISCGNEAEPFNSEQGVFGPELEIDAYHHIVTTVDQSTISFFIDGKFMGTEILSGENAIQNLSNNFAWLCKSGYTNDPTWLGMINEFNIYSGVMNYSTIQSRASNYLDNHFHAAFDVSARKILVGESVNFFDLSSGKPKSWLWDFGDGTTSIEKNPVHSFSNIGEYSVSLTIKDIPMGMVAYFPFSGNADDASGNENNGTVYGASLTNDRHGNPNSAYHFNGTSDYIRVPHSSSLDITEEITLSCWLKMDDDATYFEDILMKGADAYGIQFSADESLSPMFHTKINIDSDVNPQAGTWYHVLCTYDGEYMKIYINGILKTTEYLTNAINSNTEPLDIGYKVAFDNAFFSGTVDEIKIYNYAFDENEIADILADIENNTADNIVNDPITTTKQNLISVVSAHTFELWNHTGLAQVYSATGTDWTNIDELYVRSDNDWYQAQSLGYFRREYNTVNDIGMEGIVAYPDYHVTAAATVGEFTLVHPENLDIWCGIIDGNTLGAVKFIIQVDDGETITTILNLNLVSGDLWTHFTYDLTAWKSGTVKLRLITDPNGDTSQDAAIWGEPIVTADEIITVPFELSNVGLLGFDSPVPLPNATHNCDPANQFPVRVRLYNNGTDDMSSFTIGYSVDGNVITTELFGQTIHPGDTLLYEFQTNADLYSSQYTQVYSLSAFIEPADQISNDDSIGKDFKVFGDYDEVANWTTINSCDGLLSDVSFAIAEDKNGNIWSTDFYGLSKYDGTSWTTYTKEDGIGETYHWAMISDSNGNIWLSGANDSTITFYDGTAFHVYKQPAIFEECIYEDSQGRIWFGSYKATGIAMFDGTNWNYFWNGDVNFGTYILSISELSNGNILASCYDPNIPDRGKILQYNGTSWSEFANPNAGVRAYFSELFFDSQGNTWFASTDLNMFKFNGTSWETSQPLNSICEDISENTIGEIWFAGRRDIRNNLTGQHLIPTDGMYAGLNANIFAILADSNGREWIGTNGGGISMLNQQVNTCEPRWNPISLTNSTTAYCKVTIEGVPATAADKVAAFVGSECRGIGDIVINDGEAYSTILIQSESVETVTFWVWDISECMQLEVCYTAETNPGGNIGYPPNYLPVNVCFDVSQQVELNAGWNLVSFFADDNGQTMENIFNSSNANIQQVKNITKSWDPSIPAFLNTLTSLQNRNIPGFFVKAANAGSVEITGKYIGDEHNSPNLLQGWNLIGYPFDTQQDVTTAFNQLISNSQLVQIKNITQSYDPTVPAFLNTLSNIEPGMGYFLKTNTAVSDFIYPTPTTAQQIQYADHSISLKSAPSTRALTAAAQPGWSLVTYTNSTTAYGVVTIDDLPAAAEDWVGAFVGDECRAMQQVVINSGIAYITLLIQGETAETISFKVWDSSANKELEVSYTVQSSPGNSIGIYPNCLPIAASSISTDLQVSNTTLSNAEMDCFNAYNTVTVAGDGTTVVLSSGSSANFIAGQSIRFLPGFHAQTGSYVDAHITTNGTFCDQLPQSIVAVNPVMEKSNPLAEEELDQDVIDPVLKVYPNPNNGRFTVSLENFRNGAKIMIYNSMGALIHQESTFNNKLAVDLPETKRGIYFVKAFDGLQQYNQKIIIQ